MHRIILAGGGSAGHVEPALAVAEAIGEIDNSIQCELLGTESGLETKLVPARGYSLKTIPKVPLPRRINIAAITFPFQLIRALLKARSEIRGASVLIGFGGYVSATSYLAAWSLRIPIVIHEANARPGWANRLGRHFAAAVAVNFENLSKLWPSSIITGMPIRNSITKLAALSELERLELRQKFASEWGFVADRPIVAIFGGSLGADQINKAVAKFLTTDTGEIQIIHALGSNRELPERSNRYLPLSYFNDMAAIYAVADLLITRSGAVTCSELLTTGIPAILIPLSHGNGEQFLNAQQLAERGTARVVSNEEFTANWLSENLLKEVERARLAGRHPDFRNQESARKIAELALRELAR